MTRKTQSQDGNRTLTFRAAISVAKFSTVLAVATLLTGCGPGMAELKKDNELLEGRVTELERANRGLQVRLDAYEASITLVEDQVRALEIAQRRIQRTEDLDVVRLEPEGQHASYQEPTYQDPVYDANSRYGESSGDYEDIVVTDEKMEKYFGSARTAPESSGPSSNSANRKRTPKAPVVTGDKLAVVPMNGGAPADPIALYKAGLKEYRQQKFQPAIDLFSQFLESNPPRDYVDNALYWLGECHYGLGNYAEAAGFFHRIVEEFPDANKVPDALLKVGLTYQRQEKADSAREVLHYLIEAYPESQAAKVARKRLESLGAS